MIERSLVRLTAATLPGSNSRQVVHTHVASVGASGLVVEYAQANSASYPQLDGK